MQLQLENIPYRAYIVLDPEDLAEYQTALRFGIFPAVDHFNVGDIFSTPWGFVKDMQEAFCVKGMSYKDLLEMYLDYDLCKPERAYTLGIFHVQEVLQWTREQIELVNRAEKARLTGEKLTAAEVNAGINQLEVFRTFPQTDALALGDPLKYEEVRHKLRYSDAFLKLSLSTAVQAYRKRLNDIVNSQQKH